MKITASNGPQTNIKMNTGAAGNDKRAKAMAAFMGKDTAQVSNNTAALVSDQPIPVQNANQVQAEELPTVVNNVQEAQSQLAQSEGQTTTQADTTESKVDSDQVSKYYADLAKREKALRAKQVKQQQDLQAREQQLAEKERQISEKERQYQQGYISKDELKAETLRVLAEAGVSYDDLTADILNVSKPDPQLMAQLNKQQAQIEELMRKLEESNSSYKSQQEQGYQAAIKQITTDVTRLVESDPEFETIKATGSVQDVVELIEKTYHEDGYVMSNEEACKEIEEYLIEEAMKLTQIGKISKRLTPPGTTTRVDGNVQSSTKSANEDNKTQAATTMKTLTNANSTSPKKMSARERAIMAFKGESVS